MKETIKQRRNNQAKNIYSRYPEEVIKHMWSVHRFLLDKFGDIHDEWHLSLQMLADNLNMFIQCRDRIAVDGVIVENKFGLPEKHPLIKVQNDAQIQIVKLLQQFGLSPYAISKLKTDDNNDDELLNTLMGND